MRGLRKRCDGHPGEREPEGQALGPWSRGDHSPTSVLVPVPPCRRHAALGSRLRCGCASAGTWAWSSWGGEGTWESATGLSLGWTRGRGLPGGRGRHSEGRADQGRLQWAEGPEERDGEMETAACGGVFTVWVNRPAVTWLVGGGAPGLSPCSQTWAARQ